MSDVFFPPPRFTSSAAPKASSGVHATITHPPPATAALATGSIVKGRVIGSDAKGQVLVKTDAGVLPLQTKAQLAQGSQVTLQVRFAGSELHVVILNVEAEKDAVPRQAGDPGTQGGPRPDSQGRQAALAQAGAPPPAMTDEDVASGRLIRAVLEPAAAQGRTPGPAAGAPGAGGEVLVKLISVSAPAATSAAGPAATAPSALLAQQAGQQAPQGTPLTGPAGQGQGQALRLEGVVASALSHTPGHQGAAIDTALGSLRLAVQTALPPGTRLVMEVTPLPASQAAAQAPEAAVRDSGLARGWPALEEALRILQPGDLQPASMTLGSHALPRPGPRFASTTLFFLAALRGGDLGAWLSGSAAQALERAGRSDLVGRLKQDFARMSRLAAEPAPGEWRGYLVPVLDDGALSQVRFFVRRPESEEEGGGPAAGGRATRFVVEVAFSRFGELQLDGLIQGRRFDLILRSRAPLAPPLRRDIAEIYEAAGATTGYRGQLVFQASADWTPLPLDAMTAGTEAGVVV